MLTIENREKLNGHTFTVGGYEVWIVEGVSEQLAMTMGVVKNKIKHYYLIQLRCMASDDKNRINKWERIEIYRSRVDSIDNSYMIFNSITNREHEIDLMYLKSFDLFYGMIENLLNRAQLTNGKQRC